MSRRDTSYSGSTAWAKYDRSSGRIHPLSHHSIDVAVAFEALAQTAHFRRILTHAAGAELSSIHIEALTALAAMHDIGKIAPGFQVRSRGDNSGVDHLTAALSWHERACDRMEEALSGQFIHLIQAFTGPITVDGAEDTWTYWLHTMLAHHGRPGPKFADASSFSGLAGYDWKDQEHQVGEVLRLIAPDLRGVAESPVPNSSRLRHAYLGLLTLADWIASDEALFPFSDAGIASYLNQSRVRAARRVSELGYGEERSLIASASFELILPGAAPSKIQQAVGDAPVDDPIILLEDETGGGKTEAALLRYAKLKEAGKVESLFFAVPTRSAAKQLHSRIQQAAKNMFSAAPSVILAMPGQIVAGEARGLPAPGFNVRWDEGEADPGAKWAAERAAKFCAAEIAVGTIDQAMSAALQVSHAHLRSTTLARSLLVIDEVHASDIYMRGIQKMLIRNHTSLGGSAFLMSATLGSGARAELLSLPEDPLGAAEATSYPAVWSSNSSHPIATPGTNKGQKKVSIEVVEGWSPKGAAERAIDAARKGACVLVIRNTAGAAINTWREVFAAAPELLFTAGPSRTPTLHHSRYAAEDRNLLDTHVEQALGRRSGRGSAPGMIVIGSQTLEQSLDIDADILITDIAPIDVLLQRIGRLHRWGRRSDAPHRPIDYQDPQCIVLTPAGGYDRLLQKAENGIGSYGNSGEIAGIYTNVPSVAATHNLAKTHTEWVIPKLNRYLVERATHISALEEVCKSHDKVSDGQWSDYLSRLVGSQAADECLSERFVLNHAEELPDRYPSDENIRTRLGEMGATLKLPPGTTGPFGILITKVALPSHWSRGLGDETVAVRTEAGGLVLQCSDERAFFYDATGLSPYKDS